MMCLRRFAGVLRLGCGKEIKETQVVRYRGTKPGKAVKPGTELRILCVGDSITVGFLSDQDGGDGNGYRLRLLGDLSQDQVVYAGTESGGTMKDGYFAAWSGKTIQFITANVGPSLAQRPNVVLIHAGTNDMNSSKTISTEGNDPVAAAKRLGLLIDLVIESCPDATILVAMIVGTWDPAQADRTHKFNALVPGVVKQRRDRRVLAVDFTSFPNKLLRDGVHPTNEGYQVFGDYWYDFVTQIPEEWIQHPVGNDPDRW
ncbi:hypothetical protein KVR01_006564 [Diaporthe batatas]|uniref:uncharacterized protein n=1 Tax=Diaporthe batatas TaxID=748121 RepID=UPI001D041BED|nr:uncharacterized protein KVR01_006564 [Diaporthe batatas]KAG8163267.1 hypothetical protein KVR01_006564 [Diaporthe batatas]